MTKLLVADDSETILLLLRTRLEMEGYEVTTVNDGHAVDAALAAASEAELPDLILLDAMMPGKSGLDVLKGLRGSGDETPVLIVSAHREEEGLAGAIKMGADGLVGKPIDFEDLLSRIEKLTEKQ
jgi:DNA-binding response OmpR family regulator